MVRVDIQGDKHKSYADREILFHCGTQSKEEDCDIEYTFPRSQKYLLLQTPSSFSKSPPTLMDIHLSKEEIHQNVCSNIVLHHEAVSFGVI